MGQAPDRLEVLLNLIGDVDDFLEEAEAVILRSLTTALDEAGELADSENEQAVRTALDTILAAALTMATFNSRIRDALDELDRNARRLAAENNTTVERDLREKLAEADDQIEFLKRKLVEALIAAEDSPNEALDRLARKLDIAVEEINAAAENQITRWQAAARDVIEPILAGVEADLAPLVQRVEDAVPAILTDLGNFLGGPQSFLTNPLGALTGGLTDGLTNLMTGFLKDKFNLSALQIDPFVRELEASGALGDVVKQFTGTGVAAPIVAGIAFLVFAAQAIAITATQAFLAGEIVDVTQESMKRRRPTLLAVPELMEVLRRFPDETESSIDQLKQWGYSDEKIELLQTLKFTLVQANDLLALWRRDEVEEGELDIRLGHLGFTPPAIQELKILAFPIPGIGDLIRMAVREVFTPDIAEKFGLFEDFPTDLLPFTKAAGLTEFWARNFWAAHWELPSPNQGFEMLHRKEIDADELDLLLRALDVMPFWRDKLVAIAFNPLTRVDLRRMDALDLLQPGELQTRYEDLGFNPANATLMVKFTKAFNTKPDKDKEKEPNEFTRSQIVTFFRRGLFLEKPATDALEAIGWSPEGAQTIIDNEVIAADTRDRQRRVRVIERRFVKGLIDRGEVFEALDSIEVPEKERAELVQEMEAKRDEAVDLPSRSELDRFLRNALITRDEYMTGLENDGIPEPWRTRFADLVELELTPEERVTDVRNLTPSQLIRFLKRGIITADETLARLVALNLSDADASLMIADAIQEIPVAVEEPREFTRSLILALLKRDRITAENAAERLTALGFNEDDVALLVADVIATIAEQVPEEVTFEQKEFTRSLILGLLKRERIGTVDATERLIALGFSEFDTDILVADVLATRAEAADGDTS